MKQVLTLIFALAVRIIVGATLPTAFAPGERVAFVGDSITHAGKYIAFLQMRLIEKFPDNPPKLFNCGVNGDTAASVLETRRLEWDVCPLRPDRIFVMLGMNDVRRSLWRTAEPDSDENAQSRMTAVADYERNLRQLLDALRTNDVNIVLMTPTPYDQYGEFDDKALLSCNEPGLAQSAEIVRRIGMEKNLPVVELHGPLTAMLKHSPDSRLCGDDRVHPGDVGHSLIAAHILTECGSEVGRAEDLALALREDEHVVQAKELARATFEVRRLAEYAKVLRSMGGDGSDDSESDRLLERWVEVGRGTDWYEAAKSAARAYRELRGRATELRCTAVDAYKRLLASIRKQNLVHSADGLATNVIVLSSGGESTLTPFLPVAGEGHVPAVVICPGGGYTELCATYEGDEMARWLAARGVAAFVLRYRLAPRWHKEAMLEDVRSALKCVRNRADVWRVDPRRVGVLGFSAGGHLACMAGTLLDADRADFMALVYPHVSMRRGLGLEQMRKAFLGRDYREDDIERYSGEVLVSENTPRTFLVHSSTDEICSVEHSRLFAAAMRKHGCNIEYHELPSGRHGLGCGIGADWNLWLDAFEKWLSGSVLRKADDLCGYADPFVGCADNGHCFAAAAYPMGMVQAGPDTGNTWWDHCSGYRFADTNIIGFSQTHLSGTGCGDLGDVRVMPVKRGLGGLECMGGLAYAKSEEVAEPGYYAVTLKDAAVRVEIAAAKRSAIYRFKSLDADLPRLLVDLQYGILNWSDKTGVDRVVSCEVRREGDCRIVGSMRTKMWVERVFHFVLDFNRPIAAWEDLPKRDERERGRRFVLGFDGKGEGPLMMRFGISANSVAAAKANLSVEIPDWDLTTVRTATREAWNRILSRVEIEGTDEQKRTFYTSLYHLYIQPNDISDIGGEPYYSTFSTWDTFRAAHPLYTILSPEYVDGFVNSMLKDWRKHGYLPIWTLWGEDNQCMIGTHSVPIIVDWFMKSGGGPLRTTGLTVAVDWQEAYAAVKDTLTRKHVGRSFEPWDMLGRYGYIPFDKVGSESVSRTLEFAYDDWCAARFAEALGKRENAAFFDRRAFAWTNVFDRTTCLMRGRDSSGNWRTPFNPFKLNVGGNGEGAKDFTEGNSWQYSWHVMQHPRELITLHGGREKFADHLDRLFSLPEKAEGMGFALDATGLIGQYAHGNEPSHHTAYFFSLAGRPDRTAEIVREVCERFYQPQPDGLCGNDDCGQMSAWYLFSAMGFYPFNPCGGEYVIGAPQVSKVTLRVCSPSSKSKSKSGISNIHCSSSPSTFASFTMIAKGLSKDCKYVKSVTLNGKPIADWKIRHADIVKGGELVFEMGAK